MRAHVYNSRYPDISQRVAALRLCVSASLSVGRLPDLPAQTKTPASCWPSSESFTSCFSPPGWKISGFRFITDREKDIDVVLHAVNVA